MRRRLSRPPFYTLLCRSRSWSQTYRESLFDFFVIHLKGKSCRFRNYKLILIKYISYFLKVLKATSAILTTNVMTAMIRMARTNWSIPVGMRPCFLSKTAAEAQMTTIQGVRIHLQIESKNTFSILICKVDGITKVSVYIVSIF